jgi:hypothetical protein
MLAFSWVGGRLTSSQQMCLDDEGIYRSSDGFVVPPEVTEEGGVT